MLGLLRKVFNHNEKEIRRLAQHVEAINAFEGSLRTLSDAALAGKTAEFRSRIEAGATVDDLCHEAFAVVREASKRILGMRHFDVQLMGGLVLHEGKIAEMKTGEGKTLVATLPAYLNALAGKGVHVVTVNDYLARRDAEWMGQIYRFLGLKVGVIVHGLSGAERRAAYAADITYGTNNELGFDYLRDNMVLYRRDMVQRGLYYAIVDEVDSILIDEARTPLIISGQGEESTDLYYKFAEVVKRLRPGEEGDEEADYIVDEKQRTVAPTERGVEKVERALGVSNLYDAENMDLSRYLQNALKAQALMKRDHDYVVKDGQVIIVDEFTGRLMFGRRYSDGLHQAIEAKEGVRIQRESQTLASITFQNFFRMYEKLSGMTGTAATEEDEFQKIYNLDVVVIPTNEPMIRRDFPDVVYKTEAGKYRAVVREIAECQRRGQPVLVGTVSIESSERLSHLLKKEGIPHQVLNAKYHEKEAEIIAQAGRVGAVTIATNMAGRGTDIVLGGNPAFLARERMRAAGYPPEVIAEAESEAPASSPEVEEARREWRRILAEMKRQTDAEHEQVVALGGLHIIGTERHESRRIDNQLRGRAGRQGDPGSSRFYLSLEDDLMRLFGSDNIRGLMDRLGVDEDEPIEHNLVTKAIENAQRRVEGRNFEIRKRVLEYDDVMNQQRAVIYEQRRRVLDEESLKETILDMMTRVVDEILPAYVDAKSDPEDWDLSGLVAALETAFLPAGLLRAAELQGCDAAAIRERALAAARSAYEAREAEIGAETMRELERVILLRVVDSKWMDHLAAMDGLRDGIGLRAYAQRDPLVEYKVEAYNMFQAMVQSIREDVVRYIYRVRVEREPERRGVAAARAAVRRPVYTVTATGRGSSGAGGSAGTQTERREPVRVEKVGRNEPCPCGSGKKFKKCCGQNAGSA